jgi:hypothetical protein
MSHDPSHWEYEIKTMKKLSPNTVRSYTQEMQFGIEIPVILSGV